MKGKLAYLWNKKYVTIKPKESEVNSKMFAKKRITINDSKTSIGLEIEQKTTR